MKVLDQGKWHYEIKSVKSHDDLESWELTIDLDGTDKLIDIVYPLEEGGTEVEIAAPFTDAVRPGYFVAFLDNNEVQVVSGVWDGSPEQTYIATILSIQN